MKWWITAQKKISDPTTSYTIDRATLDHAQILNVAVSALYCRAVNQPVIRIWQALTNVSLYEAEAAKWEMLLSALPSQ